MATSKAAAAQTKTAGHRLNEIWREWSIAPDAAASAAQVKAVEKLEEWLKSGTSVPAVVIWAVQCLLADPERPGIGKRPALASVLEPLIEIWPSAGTAEKDIFFLQAMILAAWPSGLEDGGFQVVQMLDSPWDVIRGRERQQPRIEAWRERAMRAGAHSMDKPGVVDIDLKIEPFEMDWSVAEGSQGLAHLRSNVGNGWNFSGFAPQLVNVLDTYMVALKKLGSTADNLEAAVGSHVHQVQGVIEQNLTAARGEMELLWWGQAQFCHTRRLPYRRLTNTEEALWWATWEAAERSWGLEIEPAASYLVQVLRQMGQDINEMRQVGEWMERLSVILPQDETYSVRSELEELAQQDALGLPVTWLRLQAAERNRPVNRLSAAEAVALPLDAEIDRGQWASWIFREILLDRHLAEMSALAEEEA